jgi:hypothetical protein
MAIRIIAHSTDAEMAANVGGPVTTSYRTFDIDAPEVETFLRKPWRNYEERGIIGIELLPEKIREEGVM